jgi:peptide/nickel transport system substrate-binding protein/oligopeptide transport system substrate-binding protein
VALLLAACGGVTNGPANLARAQVFVWPYTGGSNIQYDEVLDPATITAAKDSPTASMLYAGLLTFDDQLGVRGDAATTWKVDSTGTVYTFNLRPNMHFSDGTPLTAADYAYSINRALDPTLCTALDANTYGVNAKKPRCSPIASVYLSYILGADKRIAGQVKSIVGQGDDPNHGVDVVDQQTLIIRLTKPVAFFLEALTYPTAYPVEQKLVEDPKNAGGTWVDHLDTGGCSGPFMVKSYGGGKQFALVPNPYWEQAWNQKLTLAEVDRPMMASPDDEYKNYLAGQYDWTTVPRDKYSFAVGQSDFNEVPTLTTDYFGLNFDKPPFDSLAVRTAFDLALNKQLLVDRVDNGAAVPTNHIVPRGMPGYDPTLRNPPPDQTQSVTGNQAEALSQLQAAQKLCTAAATPASQPDFCPYIMGATPLEIDVWAYGGDQTTTELVTGATEQWSSVLSLNVKPKFEEDQGAFFGKLQPHTDYQAWNVGWLADYPDPQDWLTLQFAGGDGNPINASDVPTTNADLMSLLAKADVDQNSARRMAEYNSAEQQIVNLVPWIPYQQQKMFWRQRSWVHGFSQNALGLMVDLNWPNVYISAH